MESHSLLQRRVWRRLIAVLTLFAFVAACRTWKVVPLTEIEAGKAVQPEARIRLHLAEGPPVTMEVQSVDFPTVTGTELVTKDGKEEKGGSVTVDLRQVREVEVWSVSGWRTAGLVVGIVVAVAALVVLIVALTKSSCPFVYVDGGNGMQFVGEAYSGATSRSVQRDDLMPLPVLGTRPTVVLSNEAQETQFTDRAEVILVDHSPGTRALATHDAGLLLAGEANPPLSATDLEGMIVLDLVRDLDGQAWLSDLQAASRRADPPTREGMVLTFRVPAGGRPLALELEAGNTPWLDLVFGRFFALLGDRLDRYLDQSDQPEARATTLAWREREGVDLRVEMERGGRWEPVAVVPTVGPASLRHFAVPLPAADGPVVRVRLSGGVGFWMVDKVAIAAINSRDVRSLRFGPVRALQADGSDARELLAVTDGTYQVLPQRGTQVRLDFELPPLAPWLVRDAFLHTSGYYRVHTPPQANLSAQTLYRLRDEPGSLSRFSLDLFRRYEEAAAGPVAGAP